MSVAQEKQAMRQPQPYLKKTHRAWYANIGPAKRPLRLASEEEGEQVAWQKYHTQMSSRQPVRADATVASLLDRYLEHCHQNLADSTYRNRLRTLESFSKYIGGLRLSALKVNHVTAWMNECHHYVSGSTTEKTGPTYRHTLMRTVKTALKWAEDEELIDHSPIRKIKLPRPRSRDVYLMPEEWAKLIARVAKGRDKGCLLDIITVTKETGCRPQEARRVEARHFNHKDRCWEFPVEESKGQRESRVVLLTDSAFEICKRLALKNPTGPLFRNRERQPWTRGALGSRLHRLS
jgi:integrase